MSCSCGWATGAHMTELSTYGTGVHVTGALGMSRGGQSTEGANVLRTLGVNVVGRPTLEAPYHGGCRRGGVGDFNGVGAGASSHNHLQSSGESNTSRAHCRSSSSVNSRPTSLSRSSVPSVAFPRGKGVFGRRGGNGFVQQASWGSGLTAVSVEDVELVGKEARVGRGERDLTRERGGPRSSSS